MQSTEIIQYDFLGLKISIYDKIELIDFLKAAITNNEKKICFGYSLGYIPIFKKFPYLYHYCNNYDLMVTDGRFFYLLAKLLGAPLKYDISIPFLSKLLMELANENNYSIMIIGSTSEENRKATENIHRNYPNAQVFDGYDGGKFNNEDQLITIEKINQNKPDILFIGVSSPKKEEFATRWKDKLDVKLIVPFGGMIDGFSGRVKLTPPFLKKIGLAAFVRVIQEPKRLFLGRIKLFHEIFFKIVPISIWYVKIRKNKEFFLPSIYGVKKTL
jgi:N-acetylglucosaminyldiphosphoundecaprenol N-acetyl-beta-D-mannosaminyltransferase